MRYNRRTLTKNKIRIINVLAGIGIGYPIGEYILPFENKVVRMSIKRTPTVLELCVYHPTSNTWETVATVSNHSDGIAAWKSTIKCLSNRGYEHVSKVFVESTFNGYYDGERGCGYV